MNFILCKLTKLQTLNFDFNRFEGTIPSTFSNFGNALRTVNLHHNKLTGTIPAYFDNWNLVTIALNHNKLVGTIPWQLGRHSYSKLSGLNLGNNKLTGTIPSKLGDLAKLYGLYLENTKFINNWDLVDISAGNIVGAYLYEKDRVPLYRLVKSQNLWERRISIISTFHFIRNYDFDDTLKIAEILLNDKEDLIQKAVGWMLREVGKREIEIEEEFLQEHYMKMPRTMLRYAIEKFPETRRKMYLRGEV